MRGGENRLTASERRRAIIKDLSVRRHEKISNLAFQYHVSRRTVEYDIYWLSLEYPIYTTKGTGGGVHVIDGAIIDLRERLSLEQYELLVKLSLSLTGKDLIVMNSILEKFYIGGVANEKQRAGVFKERS